VERHTETLTYDNLPPGSTILREWKDGALTIISAARELDKSDRRRAATMAAISAGCLTMAVGGVTGAVFLTFLPPSVSLILRQPPVIMLVMVVGLCMFAMFWLDLKRGAVRHLERGLGQHTVLIISADEMGIEIGGSTRVIRIQDVSSVEVVGSFFGLHSGSVVIKTRNTMPIQLLPGRPPAELRWLAKTLRQIIDRSAESPRLPET
jgi:hypothetical protein